MFSSSRFSTIETNVFNSAQSTSTSVVFTQRETLAFTTKFAQWIGGQIPKRDVQIAKAFLAQRLSVVNTDGKSTGELADPQFIKLLVESDAILEQAPDGLLPVALRPQLAMRSNDVIAGLLFNSRQLTVTYQQRLDAQLLKSTQDRSRNTLNNLMTLISFITLGLILLIWTMFTFKSQYRVARKILKDEAEALLVAQILLQKAESTVRTLEDLNIRMNDFISTVNHELRTPLTSIIGYIDILKTHDFKADADAYSSVTSVIDRNSKVLLEIIESILTLSSLDSSSQMPLIEKVDLLEIINRKIFVLKPQIEAKSLTLKVHHDPDAEFTILGNSGQMSQLVLNLISNAVKFSPDMGVIDVCLSEITKKNSDQFIRLEIKDQGMGIPEEDIPKLFTRFYRASNVISSQIIGTGLGLAIVDRILDLHQGSINVESEVNKGSSFIVELPQYVSEVVRHVSSQRSTVLLKAIIAIKASPQSELTKVCHEMSGALGFYDLEDEMHRISDLQRWLESNPTAIKKLVNLKKEELVSSLEASYSVLDVAMVGKS